MDTKRRAQCGLDFGEAGDVPSGMREACREAAADRIGYKREYNWNCPRLASEGAGYRRARSEDRAWSQIDQVFCGRVHPIHIAGTPAKFDPEIAAFHPSQFSKGSPERRDQSPAK